jgi:hypothetical protein
MHACSYIHMQEVIDACIYMYILGAVGGGADGVRDVDAALGGDAGGVAGVEAADAAGGALEAVAGGAPVG